VDRPRISLKLATSLDGKIALANGQSKWITCSASREKGRELRAWHDGIAIGSNTAILDDPMLTSRIDGAKDPVRIVFDSRLRLPATSKLAQSAKEVPVWIFTKKHDEYDSKLLKDKGVRIFSVPYEKGLNLDECLSDLSGNGIESLLVEGGGTIAASFLKAGYVDTIHWFRAPVILGGDGRNCIGDMSFMSLDNTPRYQRQSLEIIETDTYEILERMS